MPDTPSKTPLLPEQLSLHPGESRVVELPGYATAGYDWTAEVAEGSLTIERLPPEPPDSSAIKRLGASAPVRFRLTATEDGESHVLFTLARSWEDKPAEQHELVVSVEP